MILLVLLSLRRNLKLIINVIILIIINARNTLDVDRSSSHLRAHFMTCLKIHIVKSNPTANKSIWVYDTINVTI